VSIIDTCYRFAYISESPLAARHEKTKARGHWLVIIGWVGFGFGFGFGFGLSRNVCRAALLHYPPQEKQLNCVGLGFEED